MRHRRFLTFGLLRPRREILDHIQVADQDSQTQLTEALFSEGIKTVDTRDLAAYPVGIDFVTVQHRDARRSLEIRDNLELGPKG